VGTEGSGAELASIVIIHVMLNEVIFIVEDLVASKACVVNSLQVFVQVAFRFVVRFRMTVNADIVL
jgi:hypothetical protein